jgi:CheY-like chemotaxis protein
VNREADVLVDLPIPTKDTGEKHFDLSILLKQDNLDIREAAGAVPPLTVGEYCELLEQFTGLAPDALGIIRKFAGQDFNLDKKDSKKLEQVILLLEGLKCEKFAVDFHFLKNAYRKKSNRELAATHAEQIIDSFNGFYLRIGEAKQLDASGAKQYQDLFLKEYIEKIDKEDVNRKRLILAIDDSPDILKAIHSVLKDDYKVVPLTDPTQLESTLRHVTPDLFLLDYRMPEINGFDLIPIIRGHSGHKNTPIIFLTAVGTVDHKSAAVMLGACDFLVKPLKADALRDTIASCFKKYSPARR